MDSGEKEVLVAESRFQVNRAFKLPSHQSYFRLRRCHRQHSRAPAR